MRHTTHLVFALAALSLSACAVGDTDEPSSELEITPHVAWQLNAGLNEGGNSYVTVIHDGVVEGTCYSASCPFALLDGTVVSVSVFPVDDAVNCEIFHHWTGACAGQGPSCTLTIHGDLTTEAIYTRKKGCTGN